MLFPFTFTVGDYHGSILAVSVPQALTRARGSFVRKGMGIPPGTTPFVKAIAAIPSNTVSLQLDALVRQRYTELYNEAYHLGPLHGAELTEFTQLQKIVNDLKVHNGHGN